MKRKIKQFAAESKILNFSLNFNKNLLLYFYNSKIYECFKRFNRFFISAILNNAKNSLIVNKSKNILKYISLKDIGLFIVLIVIFNTLAMLFLEREIDIFSIGARVFFFCLGIFFIFKRR